MELTEPLTLSTFCILQKDCFLKNSFGQHSLEEIVGK